MSYRGTTLLIDCGKVGFNADRNLSSIQNSGLIYPSRNFNLQEGGIKKRGGTRLVESMGVGTIPVMYKYGSFIMRQFGSKIYRNSTTDITGAAVYTIASFAVMNEKLYITDTMVAPRIWDGVAASASTLTNLSSDWTADNYPSEFLLHGRFNSERLWAIGVDNNIGTLYYSKDNDGTDADFASSGSGQIVIDTGDNVGIIAFCEFQDRLIAFGLEKAYLIDDSDATDTNWGYIEAPWKAGAIRSRLITRIPNDLIIMSSDGNIYSIQATMTTGDYQSASISRPAFIHNYIKDYINLTAINGCHSVYDPVLRAVKFWLIKTDGSYVCLVYFIDRPANIAWAIHDGADNTLSGYKATCSLSLDKSFGEQVVYTGDALGNIWELENSDLSDNDEDYTMNVTFPPQDCGNPRIDKSFDELKTELINSGNATVSVQTKVDGSTSVAGDLTVTSTEAEIVDKELALGDVGKRFQAIYTNDSKDESVFISRIMLDFVNLGAGV